MWQIDEVVADFNDKFGSEAACIEFVEKMKWPQGFYCPSCQSRIYYRITSRRLPLYECGQCGTQTSLTANTIMHKSKTELRKWLLALYLMVNLQNSVNAVILSSVLEVTYKTAWKMLHIIRLRISRAESTRRLSGDIEAKHELFMEDIWMSDARMAKEHSIIIAREFRIGETPRYRIKVINETRFARTPLTEKHAYDFVAECCSEQFLTFAMNPRSIFSRLPSVRQQAEYNKRNKLIIIHSPSALGRQHVPLVDVSAPSLSEVVKQAAHWMNDRFNGLGPKYAQHYLDEFCFRINRSDIPDYIKFENLVDISVHLNVGQTLDGSGAQPFALEA